jgi:hypothetical protein
MAITKTVEINVNSQNAEKNVKNLTQDVNKLDKATNEVQKNTSGGFSKMSESIGQVSPALGKAQQGMKGVLTQMKAIVANPLGLVIVAIVGALTLLFKAFSSTKAGAEQLEQVMSGISAVIDVVRDRILKAGGAIVKFFSGDFKGAIADGKAAVSGFGEEVSREFRQAANATKSLQEVADAMRNLGVSRSQLNKDLALAKELLTDENALYADKKKALDDIRIAEEKQTAAELANAKKKLKAIQDQNQQSDTSAEALQREADAQIEVNRLIQAQAELGRNLNKQEKRIEAEEKARLKSLQDARNQAAKEQQEKRKEAAKIQEEQAKTRLDILEKIRLAEIDTEEKRRAEELNQIKKQYESLILEAVKYGQDTTSLKEAQRIKEQELQNKFDSEDKAREDKKAEEERVRKQKAFDDEKALNNMLIKAEDDLQAAKRNALDQGLNILMQFAGKNKAVALGILAIQKGLAIADVVVGASKSIALATSNLAAVPAVLPPGIPNPAFAIQAAATAKGIATTKISAGVNIASIIAAGISGAKSISGSGGSGLGGSISAPSGGGSVSAPMFNVVGTSGQNQIAQTLGQQPPIQAYVVSGNVSTAQSLDRNIILNASI